MHHSKSVSKHISIYSFLLFSLIFTSCYGQNSIKNNTKRENTQTSISPKEISISIFNAEIVNEIDNNIRSIYQDKKGVYWFGTNGSGVYRYDGKTILQFTVKDGLANNQVQSIQEDLSGNIWFGTGLFGVSRFDGQTFTTYTSKENLKLKNIHFYLLMTN